MAFPSPSQRKILEERYFCKALNETTLADVCRRVAGAVASVEPETPDLRRERAREEFERVLLAREFLPNTPTLFNAGVPGGGSMTPTLASGGRARSAHQMPRPSCRR